MSGKSGKNLYSSSVVVNENSEKPSFLRISYFPKTVRREVPWL